MPVRQRDQTGPRRIIRRSEQSGSTSWAPLYGVDGESTDHRNPGTEHQKSIDAASKPRDIARPGSDTARRPAAARTDHSPSGLINARSVRATTRAGALGHPHARSTPWAAELLDHAPGEDDSYWGILPLSARPGAPSAPDVVLCAGLGSRGTTGAAWYASRSWRELYDLTGPVEDFLAVIQAPISSDRLSRLHKC
jgi:hypothetical protein